MKRVANLIDGEVFGFQEGIFPRCGVRGGGEGVWFEEEPDFVTGVQEVVVAYMFGGFVNVVAGREGC